MSLSLTNSIDLRGGWLFACGSTAGQRGVVAFDLRSDNDFGYSYLTSKVIDTSGYFLKTFTTIEQLFDITDSMAIYIKTAATSSDATFNSPTTGWTLLSSFTLNNFTQIKVGFYNATLFANSPAQIQELYLLVNQINEISDKWVGSVDNSTQAGASPAYTAFRLINADSGTKYFRAYDDSGVLIASANTSANFSLFDKSTNNGTSWTPMSGANDYSSTPLTTEIRYKWATPPGVNVSSSLRDS
jgi:hypothetical protein